MFARNKVHYKGPPGESSECAPGMRPASYRDVEEEDAGAVLRHTKERKVLKLKLQERKVSVSAGSL